MASDRERYAMSYYIGRGFKPWQAAGIVGNLIQESSLNTGARNPGDGRDGSDSIGIGQWNGDRARALRQFAGARGKDVSDFDTQLAFVEHELGGTESRAGRALRASTDVHGATAAMIGFERPAGWSLNNPTGGHGWGNRFGHASRLAGVPVSPLTHTVAARGEGQATLRGDAGNDRIEAQGSGGSPSASTSPTVNIGLPSQRESKSAEAMTKAGYALGSNARNGWDAAGGLAQVLAGNIMSNRAETAEASALQKILAGRDPQYQAIAQLVGGREGAAQALIAEQENRTATARRQEEQAWRQDERDYQRQQDATANARADKTLELQTAKANAAPDQPSSVREYEYAKSQGYTGTYQEWETQNRKAGATVVNTGQDEGEFQKKAAGRMVERFGGIADAGAAAATTAQTIPVMRELLTQAPNGPIVGALAERFRGFSTAGDAFQTQVKQLAPTMRVPGSGAQSDKDMDILIGGFPQMGNDPAANGLIMDLLEKKAKINLDRADIANKALRGEISPADADRQLAEMDRIPLFDDAMRSRLTGQPPARQSGSLVPGSDGGGQRYEGGVPVGAQDNGTAPVRRAVNRQTGEVLELRNGQWVPAR